MVHVGSLDRLYGMIEAVLTRIICPSGEEL